MVRLLALVILAAGSAASVCRAQVTTYPAVYGTNGLSTAGQQSGVALTLGFNNQGDGGGGYYQAKAADCGMATAALKATGGLTLTAGNPVVSFSGITSGTLVQNMTVVLEGTGAPTDLPIRDPVQAYQFNADGVSGTITLYIPPTSSSSSAANLTFSTENGGTKVRSYVLNEQYPKCFVRITSSYSQQEWGAGIVSTADDTAALQNWIESPQPHIAVPGTSTISSPLTCDTATAIQGPATQAVAEDPSIMPQFIISGNNGLYNGYAGLSNPLESGAMLEMTVAGQCAIHSVGLVADAQTASVHYDVLHANGKSNLVDQHSYLAKGFHNVVAVGGGANFEAYDSSFNSSYDDNVIIATPNAKVIRNSLAGAGTGFDPKATTPLSGTNLKFGGVDIVIADNIIQQAAGWGVNLVKARSVRMTGNFFDNNGRSIPSTATTLSPTGALAISSSAHVTVCGNTFSESAAGSEGISGLTAAHVYFMGNDDSVSFCGNVYLPIVTSASNASGNSDFSSVLIHPDYSFDAAPGTSVTNVSIADNPAPQNMSFLSPQATQVLNESISNKLIPGYISGLGLSITGLTTVEIAAGTGTDSSNAGLIILGSP